MRLVTDHTAPRPSLRRPRWLLAMGLALALAFLAPLASQAQEAEANETSTVAFKLHHIQTRHLVETLRMLGIRFQQLPDLDTIVVTGDSTQLTVAKKLIDTLDLPPDPARSVEVKVYVLAASREAESSGGLPEALQSVARSLESSLGYRGFSLIDTLFLRTEDGSQGGIAGGGNQTVRGSGMIHTRYEFGFDEVSIVDRKDGRVLRFDSLWYETGAAGENMGRIYSAALRTDVEVREGKMAVIGKATPSGTDQALVLVVTARVVE